jgi:hypothetical protein
MHDGGDEGAAVHEHMSLRDRLEALTEHREPAFEPSEDPTLVAFSKLFAKSGLFALDASKTLSLDALSTMYDCETESRHEADAVPEKFDVIWTPVWSGDDPVTGFRRGRDSAAFGSTPTVVMPQDERTAALLLLVTSTFVHLSASRAEPVPLIRGAVDADGGAYRFVTLDRAVNRARARTIRESRRGQMT